MNVYVYKIENIITGAAYVGLTNHPDERLYHHFNRLLKGKSHHPLLQADYNQYGESNYTFEILETTPKDFGEEREAYWINEIPHDKSLNIQKREGNPKRAFDRIREIRRPPPPPLGSVQDD